MVLWRVKYAQLRPVSFVDAECWSRRQVNTWIGSAGVGKRLASAMHDGETWNYAVVRLPEFIQKQFACRNCHRIGATETLAVAVVCEACDIGIRNSVATS